MKPSPTVIRKHLRYVKSTGQLWWRLPKNGRRMNRPTGAIETNGYVCIGFDGKVYKAHILAWVIVKGRWPKKEMDHRDLNRANNKWKNLRLATHGQNQRNGRCYKNNTSGYKGVHFHPMTGRWTADINLNKKPIYLGIFDTPEEAAVVYNRAAKKYHGSFARTA